MRTMILVAAAGALALAACSKAEQKDTTHDVQAAADKLAAGAKDAAQSPEVKKAGAELKEAAGDVGHVLKQTAKGAAEGARQGAAEVEGKDAADRTQADGAEEPKK